MPPAPALQAVRGWKAGGAHRSAREAPGKFFLLLFLKNEDAFFPLYFGTLSGCLLLLCPGGGTIGMFPVRGAGLAIDGSIFVGGLITPLVALPPRISVP